MNWVNNKITRYILLFFLALLIFFLYFSELKTYFGEYDFQILVKIREKWDFFTYPISLKTIVNYNSLIAFGLPFLKLISSLPFNPFLYHIIALIQHLLITFIVYLIFVKILESHFAALSGALYYGILSVHWFNIRWIRGVNEFIGIGILFLIYLLLISCFWIEGKWNLKLKLFYCFSIMFYLLSLFISEIAIIFPLIILFHLIIMGKNENLFKLKKICYISPFLLISLLFCFLRFKILNIPIFEIYSGKFTLSTNSNLFNYAKFLTDSLTIREIFMLAGSGGHSPSIGLYLIIIGLVLVYLFFKYGDRRAYFGLVATLGVLIFLCFITKKVDEGRLSFAVFGSSIIFATFYQKIYVSLRKWRNKFGFTLHIILIFMVIITSASRKIELSVSPAAKFSAMAKIILEGVKKLYPTLPPETLIYILIYSSLSFESNIDTAFKVAYNDLSIQASFLSSENVQKLANLKEKGIDSGMFFEFVDNNLIERKDIQQMLKQDRKLDTLMQMLEKTEQKQLPEE